MKYTYNVNNKSVFFYCDESLKKVADFFVNILIKQDSQYGVVKDNNIIQISWSCYKILKKDDGYQIFAFDLEANPFKDITEDLSLSLNIFFRQSAIINKTKLVPESVSFQNTMIVKKSALSTSEIYLERCKPTNDRDSGWYMGTLHEGQSNNTDDYAMIYTCELLSICPSAIDLLQLPIGTMAIFNNGELIEAVDQNNNKIL